MGRPPAEGSEPSPAPARPAAQIQPSSPGWYRRRHLRVVAALALVALGPLALLTYSSIRLGGDAVHSQVQARVTDAATTSAELVGQQMQDLASLVQSDAGRAHLATVLAHDPLTAADQTYVASTLAGLQQSRNGIAIAFVTNPSGRLIDITPTSPSIVGQDFSYRDWYRGVMAGGGRPYVSEAYQTAATNQARVVAAAAQIRGPAQGGQPGPVVGVLVAGYDLQALQHFVDGFASADAVRLTVTDQHGTVLAAPGAGTNPTQMVSQRSNPAVAAALLGRSGTLSIGSGAARVLSAYAPVPGLGWTVRAEVPTDVAFASSTHLRDTVEAIAALLTLVLLGGLALLAVSLRRRERAEELRGESEAFLDSVIENIPHMVFIKDAAELRFVRLNRAAEELLGYERDELLAKNDYDFFPAAQADFFTASDRAVLAGGGVLDIPEEPILTKDGEPRILHTKKMALCGADGIPRYLMGISEDITDRHADQIALAQAKEEAERANLAKSEFLSRMSHELRTPLNAILGFAQLLELKELAPDDCESTEQILRGGRHLLSLINEVLDLSRIESGTLSLSPEPVEVTELVDETASLVRPLADERRIELVVSGPPGGTAIARADRQRLKQVLLNLASNAVKYNRDEGAIRFACDTSVDGKVRIDVADTGPGLSSEQISRLFVPFERLDAQNSAVEGTGIGLALSRRLVEAMAGTLEVHSTPGRGATFTVELPSAQNPLAGYAAGEVAARSASLPSDVTGGVLHIEDNPSNLRLVERVLSNRRGVDLVSSTRGARGLELARQHRPDLILLDLHLPDLPGIEVLARLQADPATSDIPVVVLSADATPGQIDRLLAAGARHYLTKPLDVAELLAVLDGSLAGAKA